MGDAAQKLFVDVLMYCDELGLIGKEMFAVDGCKLPSNASKEQSGTRADFENRRKKFKAAIDRLVKKHRERDADGKPEAVPGMREAREAIETLKAKAAKIEQWLRGEPDTRKARADPGEELYDGQGLGQDGVEPRVVQGYNGLMMVDAKHQVIVGAEAFGKGHDAEVFEPIVDQVRDNFRALGEEDIYKKAKVTADSGFHTEESAKMLAGRGVDAYVPDKLFRQRDPAFQTARRHRIRKALVGRSVPPDRNFYAARDFVLNPENGKLICPAGKELYLKDRNFKTANGYYGPQYKAKITDCRACGLRTRCLRNPEVLSRTVAKFTHRLVAEGEESFSQKMIRKIGTEVGRYLYGMRMGIVEPVFANLRHMLGLDRFTLRGKAKVNIQWLLFAVVHNIHKAQRFGFAGTG